MEILPDTIEKYKDAFADRLREFMNGRSILQFSKDIGFSQRTVNSWVRKRSLPRIEYLVVLSEMFDCSIKYLIGLED